MNFDRVAERFGRVTAVRFRRDDTPVWAIAF